MVTAWDIENIEKQQRQLLFQHFENKSKEEILEYLVRLRAAVFGIECTLSSNDWAKPKPWSGTKYDSRWFTSDLFLYNHDVDIDDNPSLLKKNKDGNYEWEKFEPDYSKPLPEEIQFQESTALGDEKINDSIKILSAHGSSLAAYIGGGSITFGDARHLSKVFNLQGD